MGHKSRKQGMPPPSLTGSLVLILELICGYAVRDKTRSNLVTSPLLAGILHCSKHLGNLTRGWVCAREQEQDCGPAMPLQEECPAIGQHDKKTGRAARWRPAIVACSASTCRHWTIYPQASRCECTSGNLQRNGTVFRMCCELGCLCCKGTQLISALLADGGSQIGGHVHVAFLPTSLHC